MKVSGKTEDLGISLLKRRDSDGFEKISYGKVTASGLLLNRLCVVFAALYIHHNDTPILLRSENHGRHRRKGIDMVYAYFADSSLF